MYNSENNGLISSAEFELINTSTVSNSRAMPQHSDKPPAVNSAKGSLIVPQIRAILCKNISFQKRQIGMNIFQLLSPLVCVLLIWTVKYELSDLLKDDFSFNQILGIPFFLNLPSMFLRGSSAYPIASLDCYKWFMYADRRSPNPNNLPLEAIARSQFFEYCQRVDSYVPMFAETAEDVNKQIFDKFIYLQSVPFRIGHQMDGLDSIPDAGLTFNEYTKNALNVDIQVNDLLFLEYHRDNGFSKISFRVPGSSFRLMSNFNKTFEIGNSSDLTFEQRLDRLNKTFDETQKEDEEEAAQANKPGFQRFRAQETTVPVR